MSESSGEATVEHFEVLIVGAGMSGIGAGYRLIRSTPGRSFVILDEQASFGGTWHTCTFPGIRSDSDLFTFGYDFKPWMGPPIASGAEILRYMEEVISENGLAKHVRYRHRITHASWDSSTSRWTVRALEKENRTVEFTAGFLFMCQGYFRHREGYVPDWQDRASYCGEFIHTQEWPEDVGVAGKRVVVIGSGATAATVVPELAKTADHVVLLQRSPTYFWYSANANELADRLRALKIDERWVHEIVRRDNLAQETELGRRCFEEPDVVRAELLRAVAAIVGEDITAKHFSPRYRPWQQRLAFLPDGDMLTAIRDGKVSAVTDEIERFTANGVRLRSGAHLDADVIVAATGFNMNVFGDIDFEVDGAAVDFAETVTYRGMMFTGVPNFAWVFGYLRQAWTLRSDLVSRFLLRLLDHMDRTGAKKVVPVLPAELRNLEKLPWISPDNFNAGYLMRALHLMPKRLDHENWRHSQDYFADRVSFPNIALDAPDLDYGPGDAAELDPDIAAWLSGFPESPKGALDHTPVDLVREGYREQVRAGDRPGPADINVSDLVIRARGGNLTARRYAPSGAWDGAGLVYFHGGGFVLGDLETHDGHCRRLARNAGVCVVAVDYRLAPQDPFPAAHEDAEDAYRWVHANSELFGLDPTRIAIGGDSAGANLAASVSIQLKEDARLRPSLALLIYPVTWPTPETPSRRALDGPILTHEVMTWFERHLAADDHPGRAKAHLAHQDLDAMPATILITAGHDPLKDEGRMLVGALRRQSVECEHLHFPTLTHDFCLLTAVSACAAEASQEIAKRVGAALTPRAGGNFSHATTCNSA